MRLRVLFLLTLAAGLGAVLAAQTSSAALPPIKRQPTPKAVVDEHLAAINQCDWPRLMAQYPPDVEFFLPGGQVQRPVRRSALSSTGRMRMPPCARIRRCARSRSFAA